MSGSSIAVIGAGPCGLGVGIAARRAGIDCTLLDKGCVVSSIARYPTWMTFFSTARKLELGGVPFTIAGDKPTRREALRYYQRLAAEFDLDIRQYEEVRCVTPDREGFRLDTRRGTEDAAHRASHVVVATGYFDHPNRLNVPGEHLPHVMHGYREGHPFFDQNVVIVGGGNSAVDAALELFRWGARVTLVHFLEDLDPGVKPWVQPDIRGRIKDGSIGARWNSRITEIRPDVVVIRNDATGAADSLRADWVLTMTGYTPDPWLLRSLGVSIDAETGIPVHDPATMETDAAGVYVAGVVVAGNRANKVFIENGRDHGDRIVQALLQRTGGEAPETP